jgi:hypothetical protein
MKENGIGGKEAQPRISPNNSKARGSNQKGANPREILEQNPREHVSIATKWDITPKIAPSPNPGLGALRY